MQKSIFVFVNGICNWPGSARGWTDRAVEFCSDHTDDVRGEKFEYWAMPLTRRIFLARHARDLAARFDTVSRNARLVACGHSNGAELICRAITMTTRRISEVHLISGACKADFKENGLGDALENGDVGQVRVYVAGKDYAMWWARASENMLSWAGLGYGTLGLRGPVDPVGDVVTHVEPTFGHSDWFRPEHLDNTMRMILGSSYIPENQCRGIL